MKKIFLLALFLLTACSIQSGARLPVPTRPALEATRTAVPTLTETLLPDTYPYPVFEPVLQATSYPYPVETSVPTPTLTLIPTATIIRPTATFPPSLASLRIAFTSEKKLSLWYRGETKLLTEMEEGTALVKISSDGEIIAYKLSSGLWSINADGTGKRLLVGNDRIKVVNPAAPEKKSRLSSFKWIPNTHRLLLSTDVDTEGQCCYIDNNDLYMVDADTLNLQTLLPPGKAGAFVNISPDGKRAAMVSWGGIDLLNLNTREKYNLIQYEPVMFPSEVGGYLDPLWSSNSQYLMVVVPPPDIHYGTKLPSKIWKLPVNHGAPKLVSTLGPEFGFVTLSPDFLKVATQQQIGIEGGDRVLQLHIASVDGSDDEIYQSGRVFFSGWSPDSAYFLFDGPDRTYYLGQKGASPVEFPFPAHNLRWLDGQTFLYQDWLDELDEIRLGFLDGSSTLLVGSTSINNYDFTR